MTSPDDPPGDPVAVALRSRDRVLDAAKAAALLVVVLAHASAWDIGPDGPRSILDHRPQLVPVTWALQVLPLFFAAGAVANLGSWRRSPQPAVFWRRRLVRLATPGVLYAGVWTLVLLPVAAVEPLAEPAGRFLAQLLWFLGVYGAVVVAAPWTARWTTRPWLVGTTWLAAVALIDVLRLSVAPAAGWLNLLAVWGFVHQVGYHLPALRTVRPVRLLTGAAGALTAALLLAGPGPYSSSLVSYAGDPAPSNLSPPTLLVALYGLAQVLLLAAAWPWLSRALAPDRRYRVIAGAGSRAVGVYLWHIPLVATVAALAWVGGLAVPPLGAWWWAAHLAGLALLLPTAWWLAGLAGRAEHRLLAWVTRGVATPAPDPSRGGRVALAMAAVAVPAALLGISTTGFGTWWGPGPVGSTGSSVLTTGLLVLAWVHLARTGGPAQQPAA